MKKAVGGMYVLNLIIIFLLIMLGFLMALFSYTKAYKTSKGVLNILENDGGYNDLSKNEIEIYLNSMGYRVSKLGCPDKGQVALYDETGVCIYKFDTYKDVNKKDIYATYGVVSYMYIDFPLLDLIKIPVYGETDKIYVFK